MFYPFRSIHILYTTLYTVLFCKVATPAKRIEVFWTKSHTVWIVCCGAAGMVSKDKVTCHCIAEIS